MKSFLSILDFDAAALERCLERSTLVKRERSQGSRATSAHALDDKHVALLFDKPSLRTRVTFEIAIREIGAFPILLPPDVALGVREPVSDVARNLERWVHGVVIRTFAQATVAEFAAVAPRLSVINALTDQEHPCQALADFLTLQEHWGGWRGRRLAFVGDGNNVAVSLAHTAAMLGTHFAVASPEGFELPAGVVDACGAVTRYGATTTLYSDPVQAVSGADAVYTDVWTSMGQEADTERRRQAFGAYQVNAELMGHARSGALVMHCLPAKRGQEITADVLESPASVVFDQAENRLHTQKALLLMLLA